MSMYSEVPLTSLVVKDIAMTLLLVVLYWVFDSKKSWRPFKFWFSVGIVFLISLILDLGFTVWMSFWG